MPVRPIRSPDRYPSSFFVRSSSAGDLVHEAQRVGRQQPLGIRPPRRRGDLDARQIDAGLDGRHRLARDVLRHQDRALGGLGRRVPALAFSFCSLAVCCPAEIRSQTSMACSPFMPSSARSRANTSAVITRGRDVDVVGRPYGRQHLPLPIANLAAHGRQQVGPDDAVGRHPEERVALDDLKVEEPPRDPQEPHQHDEGEVAYPASYLWELGVLPGYFHDDEDDDDVVRPNGCGPRARPTRDRTLSTFPSRRRNSPSTMGPAKPVSNASSGACRRPP